MYMGGMRGNMIPAGAALSARGRVRTMLGRRALPARGGQLEIAGVVVGQWGPNYPGGGGGRGRGNMYMEPQVPVNVDSLSPCMGLREHSSFSL